MRITDRLQNQANWLDNGSATLLLYAKECIEDFKFLIDYIERIEDISDAKNIAMEMRKRYFRNHNEVE